MVSESSGATQLQTGTTRHGGNEVSVTTVDLRREASHHNLAYRALGSGTVS